MATFIYDGTPIPILASGTLRYVAVDSAGNYVEGSAVYDILPGTIALSQLPYATVNSITGDATINYTTLALGLWADQKKQTATIAASVRYPAAVSAPQKVQTVTAPATVKYSATFAAPQKAQTATVPATVKYSATVAESQAKATATLAAVTSYPAYISAPQKAQTVDIQVESGASTANIKFIAPIPPTVDTNGVIHYTTQEIVNEFFGEVVALSPLQTQIILATVSIGGTVDSLQAPQTCSVSAINTPTGVWAEQQPQTATITASVSYLGTVDAAQQPQTSTIQQGNPIPSDISVTSVDPYAISVTSKDPFAINVIYRDPYAIRVERKL